VYILERVTGKSDMTKVLGKLFSSAMEGELSQGLSANILLKSLKKVSKFLKKKIFFLFFSFLFISFSNFYSFSIISEFRKGKRNPSCK